MPASPPTPAGSREREVRHRAARIEDWIHDVRERWARRRGHVPTVVPYTGYGSTEWVRVLCRVLLSRPIAADEPSKRRRKRSEQGIRGWRSFTSVPVGDVPVVIEVGGERLEVLADRGGVVDTRVPVALAPGWHRATLQTEGSEPVEAPIWSVPASAPSAALLHGAAVAMLSVSVFTFAHHTAKLAWIAIDSCIV